MDEGLEDQARRLGNEISGSNMKSTLHKQVFLPFLSSVSCGGFFLYGTPLIYTQEYNEQDMTTTDDDFQLPRILSAAGKDKNGEVAAALNDVLQQFAYLHANIKEETLRDPMFNLMPILKNITRKNLIPTIDFEEFNQTERRYGQNSARTPLTFLTVYLADTLHNMVPEAESHLQPCQQVTLFKIPHSPNMEIECFDSSQLRPSKAKRMPGHLQQRSVIDFDKISDMLVLFGDEPPITQKVAQTPGKNQKKQQAHRQPPTLLTQADADDMLEKLYFSKHGWNFVMVMARTNSASLSHHKRSENKRATTFFRQRDNLLSVKKTAVGPATHFQTTKKEVQPGYKMPQLIATPNACSESNVKEDASNSTADKNMIRNVVPNSRVGAQDAKQYFSNYTLRERANFPKQSILKRTTDAGQDSPMFGHALISAQPQRPLKLKFAMTQHAYSKGVEKMLDMSVNQVVKILDFSDKINNIAALKDLMHRKGLNMRFGWLLLSKVKLIFSRELIMIDLLCRVMRKVINEEMKLKTQHMPTTNSKIGSGLPAKESGPFFLGNQLDSYKEVVVFYVNAILKNKFCKYRQVFDETLLGLFLSRMRVFDFAISEHFSLRKEQQNYFESRDILENVIEAASKNPVLFLNSIQTYFNIQFENEFMRQARQDKIQLLNRNQPLQVGDLKNIELSSNSYFSLKEYAYLILARKIAFNSRQRNAVQTLAHRDSVRRIFSKKAQGPPSHIAKDPSKQDTQRISSQLKNPQAPSTLMAPMPSNNNQQTTHRNFQNIGQGDTSQSRINKEDSRMQNVSQHNVYMNRSNSYVNQNSLNAPPTSMSNVVIDLSQVKKANQFHPTSANEMILPPALYKLKMCPRQKDPNTLPVAPHGQNELIAATKGKRYQQDSDTSQQSNLQQAADMSVCQPYYALPNIDVINEWVIVLESLLKDVISVGGSEQVLIEAFIYQAIMTFFYDKDADGTFKILQKIRDTLYEALRCAPETIIMAQTLIGLYMDNFVEMFPLESEKSYLACLICVMQVYGDPRGRGNFGIPFSLLSAWKLSLLALADTKKLHDSEAAEEFFDATLHGLYNHRRFYKSQQMEIVNAQHAERDSFVGGNSGRRLGTNQSLICEFELTQERQERQAHLFSFAPYTHSEKHRKTLVKYVQPQKLLPNTPAPSVTRKQAYFAVGMAGSIPQVNVEQTGATPNLLKMKKNEADNLSNSFQGDEEAEADLSDIDLDFSQDYSQSYQRLMEENHREDEYRVKKCPFPHWTVNRQIYEQQIKHHKAESPEEAKEFLKETMREIVTKSLEEDTFFSWLINFNPMAVQTGTQWNSQQIKEVVFCQNQQMVSSSNSSAILSVNNMSVHSHRSNMEQKNGAPSRRRNTHLGTYSQILGKEVGGIQKTELQGALFVWGTDMSGQLGLDTFVVGGRQFSVVNSMKVLFPRIMVPLKDELIKEVCCGYTHTLAINQYGQMFSWGNNSHGQLGLGPKGIPMVVRKPCINIYVANVAKLGAGNEHSLALTKSGDLYIWGSHAVTGLKDTENRTIPTLHDFFANLKIQQVASGGLHIIVLCKGGDLYSWGSTEGGQLGLGQLQTDCIKVPAKITGINLKGNDVVQQVACGEAHTVALTREGRLWVWGIGMYGQLGLGFSQDSFEPGVGMEKSKVILPREIPENLMPSGVHFAKVQCGSTITLVLTDQGELYGCGINDLGQLGLDTYIEEMNYVPLDRARRGNIISSDVTVLRKVICFEHMNIASISCGENHSLAIMGEDRKMMWAWGSFRNGQLGLGEVTMKMNPRPIQTLCSSHIHKIAAGSLHSLALLGDASALTTIANNFYLNSEVLGNPWAICHEERAEKDEADT